MSQSVSRTVLITGASCGIGEALACEAASEGHDVVLVARSQDVLAALAARLEQQYGVRATAISMDLSAPRAATDLVGHLNERALTVDVLINNAGFGALGPFSSSDRLTVLDMMSVNIVALTELTHHLLPGMIDRGWGRIGQVSSVGGFFPGPLHALYYATKAFVCSLSAALDHELKGSGVSVTALCPGPTKTQFGQRAGMLGHDKASSKMVLSSLAVATEGFEAIMAGRRWCVPGYLTRGVCRLARFLPQRCTDVGY